MSVPSGAIINVPESLHLPDWLTHAAADLVQQAEGLFRDDDRKAEPRAPGNGRGKDRKAWVKRSLRDLARNHDLAAIPDWIESPLEALVIDLVVEAAFALGGRHKLVARAW